MSEGDLVVSDGIAGEKCVRSVLIVYVANRGEVFFISDSKDLPTVLAVGKSIRFHCYQRHDFKIFINLFTDR